MFALPVRSVARAARGLKVPGSLRPLSSPTQPSPSQPQKQTAPPVEVPPNSAIQSAETEQLAEQPVKEWADRLGALGENTRLPRSVQAIYLRPLRRRAEHGLPVCDLQLRSYSVRNVEFFADFAIRAAYYLNLPVSGPIPLPRIVERWTVPRSNFVHKKSQENFERITLRRLIQIKDGDLQAVEAWLAFLRKHAFYGVGMKANVWEHESLDVGKAMDSSVAEIEKSLGADLAQFGLRKGSSADRVNTIFDNLDNERFKERRDI
ncbi:hypothetical protein N7474_002656 [Penicillium riverlandense]|uniref:uncharacterized protein n=1 Tax=Penicillium riverlandense TaxID=1903569 RepID=UPI002547E597|nr:uncharacterized protein N7474_002656 [Penicillium riverlandense]KAJ5825518.1 hypothetical protein N7474_002656 [Penicillium riverlandense]